MDDVDFLQSTSIMSTAAQEADAQENILRPKYLKDFQGQKKIKETVKATIVAKPDVALKTGEGADVQKEERGEGKRKLCSM